MVDDLISRRLAIEALYDWEMTYDWDEHCREEPKSPCIVSPSDVIDELPPAQPEPSQVARDIATIIENEKDMRVIAQPEIIHCKDCKHWKRQTNYQGAPLSFGFCESDDMWRSLYGETCEISHIDTDDDFYCGYAERREDG